MRIQLFSDLHLERDPHFRPVIAADTDVVVVAGDVGSYQPGSRLHSDDFGLERFSPLRSEASSAKVLYVPGNHEFDSLEFDEAYERLREACERLGITWLDREVVTIGHARFVGTTLWSDFDALIGKQRDLSKQLQARTKAFRAANYYLSKNTTLKGGEPVLAEGIREMSLACQDWRRRDALRPQPAKRRPALRARARHGRLLQFDGPPVSARGRVDAWAPALRERLRGRGKR
jgi:hypothetical protein